MSSPKRSEGRGRRRIVVGVAAWVVGTLVLLALFDGARPWRRLQVEFLRLEADHLMRREAIALDRQSQHLAELDERTERARQSLEDRAFEVAELEDELDRLGLERRQAEARRRQALERGDRETARLARREIESLEELATGRREQLAILRFELEAVTEERHRALAELATIEERLETVERWAWLREVPILGSFVPPIAIRERLPDPSVLRAAAGEAAEPSRTRPPHVERCTTCHLAADRDDLTETNWSPPLRPHPRRELFVAPGSPHPVERFGCVVCHGGEGRATDFERAGHRPRSERQAADWRQRLDYHPPAQGTRTMLPAPLVEASCGQCHRGTLVEARALEQMPDLVEGRRLRRRLGCDGCHTGSEVGAFPGSSWAPSLLSIAAKTTPSKTERFLSDPDSHPWIRDLFVPLDDDLAIEGSAAEIGRVERLAVISTLWHHSRQIELEAPPQGDASRGEALFLELGCAACHLLEGPADHHAPKVDSRRLLGRSLARAWRLDPAWLFRWLLDPASLEPATTKGNPRLVPREAADLAAFLLASGGTSGGAEEAGDHGGTETAATGLPAIDVALRDRMVLRELERLDTLEGAAARFAVMGERERTLFLGERRIERRGCRGCHALKELTHPAAPIPRLDRSAISSWIAAAVEAPFEHRYPGFELSIEATRQLKLALLADLPPTGSRSDRHVPGDLSTAEGLMATLGCGGCHAIRGVPSALASLADEERTETVVAPRLDGVGARLRPSWLTALLADPAGTEVRPWIALRMPRYRLGEREIERLAEAFVTRQGVSWVDLEPAAATDRELALGRAVWELLQCDICHLERPTYDPAAQRLRPEWTVDWILDPRRFDSDSTMPTLFVDRPGEEPDTSFLLGSLETPMFATQYQRLRRAFDSEEEMRRHVRDPHRIALALRAYLWQRSRETEP